MIVVVSDASPIRCLHHLDLLNVLSSQFQRMIVPPAVVNEIGRPSKVFPPIKLSSYPFFEVIAPIDLSRVRELRRTLDSGESEAIALAIETPGAGILIDEADGRNAATEHGLQVIGTLRVLIDAKKAGHVTAVIPLIQRLIEEIEFFVSPTLIEQVRQLAGED